MPRPARARLRFRERSLWATMRLLSTPAYRYGNTHSLHGVQKALQLTKSICLVSSCPFGTLAGANA